MYTGKVESAVGLASEGFVSRMCSNRLAHRMVNHESPSGRIPWGFRQEVMRITGTLRYPCKDKMALNENLENYAYYAAF
jgi:hypothetical protein